MIIRSPRAALTVSSATRVRAEGLAGIDVAAAETRRTISPWARLLLELCRQHIRPGAYVPLSDVMTCRWHQTVRH